MRLAVYKGTAAWITANKFQKLSNWKKKKRRGGQEKLAMGREEGINYRVKKKKIQLSNKKKDKF